jgi:hypothetical protein
MAQKIITGTQKICDAILEKTIFEHSKSKNVDFKVGQENFSKRDFLGHTTY